MITLDTSALYTLHNGVDPRHRELLAIVIADRGPYVVPSGILAEIAYMLETALAPAILRGFLSDLESGRYRLDCGENDFPRVRTLVERYEDLRLGFADSVVIACAERNGGRVLTLDQRHFPVVARGERTISVLPDRV